MAGVHCPECGTGNAIWTGASVEKGGDIYRCTRTRSHVFTVEKGAGASAPAPAPPVARARRGDPETSHEAAQSVTGITEKQAAVLRCFDRSALTDSEMMVRYVDLHDSVGPHVYPLQSPSGLRSRRNELVGKKKLRFAQEYRTTPSGRRARVWEEA